MRRPLRISLLVGWAAAAVAVLAPPAAAHRPEIGAEGGITAVPDSSTSYAYYRELAPGEVDVYAVEARAGDDVFVGVTIPAIDGLDGFGVTLALVGPGLPQSGLDELPDGAPLGEGALVIPDRQDITLSETGVFFEPFTQTRYRERQRIDGTFPADGVFHYVVWQPSNETGKYVLDTGRREVFGPLDVLAGFSWWFRVNAYFGHWLRIALASAVLAAVAVFAARGALRLVGHRRRGASAA